MLGMVTDVALLLAIIRRMRIPYGRHGYGGGLQHLRSGPVASKGRSRSGADGYVIVWAALPVAAWDECGAESMRCCCMRTLCLDKHLPQSAVLQLRRVACVPWRHPAPDLSAPILQQALP